MLVSAPFSLLIGTVFGFLAGLGVGGGSLLMLWLTLVVQMTYFQARTVNLLFFIPTALICSGFRLKQGSLKLRKIWPAILAGILSSAAMSLISKGIDTSLLKKAFGILLLLTGIREVFYRPRNAR